MSVVQKGNRLVREYIEHQYTAGVAFQAFQDMGYTAMGMGPLELILSPEILQNLSSRSGLTLVNTNLKWQQDRQAAWRDFLIVKSSEIRVGIVSVIPDSSLNADYVSAEWGQAALLRPEAALENTLPEVDRQSDLIVLISHCSPEKTQTLMEKFLAVDVLVDAYVPERSQQGCGTHEIQDAATTQRSLRFSLDKYGMDVVQIQLRVEPEGALLDWEASVRSLDNDVPEDTILRNQIALNLSQEKIRSQYKDLKELWKMDPEEYFQTRQKKDSQEGVQTHHMSGLKPEELEKMQKMSPEEFAQFMQDKKE